MKFGYCAQRLQVKDWLATLRHARQDGGTQLQLLQSDGHQEM
jgi:hypothetical protein